MKQKYKHNLPSYGCIFLPEDFIFNVPSSFCSDLPSTCMCEIILICLTSSGSTICLASSQEIPNGKYPEAPCHRDLISSSERPSGCLLLNFGENASQSISRKFQRTAATSRYRFRSTAINEISTVNSHAGIMVSTNSYKEIT